MPLAVVRDNFSRFGLLDGQVRFLKGYFRDTLPKAPIPNRLPSCERAAGNRDRPVRYSLAILLNVACGVADAQCSCGAVLKAHNNLGSHRTTLPEEGQDWPCSIAYTMIGLKWTKRISGREGINGEIAGQRDLRQPGRIGRCRNSSCGRARNTAAAYRQSCLEAAAHLLRTKSGWAGNDLQGRAIQGADIAWRYR